MTLNAKYDAIRQRCETAKVLRRGGMLVPKDLRTSGTDIPILLADIETAVEILREMNNCGHWCECLDCEPLERRAYAFLVEIDGAT